MNLITKLKLVLDPLDMQYTPKEQFRLAAVLIPIFVKEERILLTKRPQHMKHHQGQIAFPGGKFEDSDKNLQTTALRETNEEVGISPDDIQIIGKLTPTITISNHYVHPFVGIISNDVRIKIDPEEVAEYFFVPISILLDKKIVKKGVFIGGIRKYYEVNKYKIWGVTEGIISDLICRLKET